MKHKVTLPKLADHEHLTHIQTEFDKLVAAKYMNGVAEHGHMGHLWDRAVDREALNEAIDQVTYLITLVDQLDKACEYAREALADEEDAKVACYEILMVLGREAGVSKPKAK